MTWIESAAEGTLRELLEVEARLVTVFGLGGSGASSLVARALSGKRFVVVDLRGCQSAAEVSARLPAMPKGLIFVDNAHATELARAAVSGLLREPVRVVVAPRAPLGLDGENLVAVPALDAEGSRTLLLAELRRLGVLKTSGVDAKSRLVESVVQALDGWPLALRGAAMGVRVLGVGTVLRRGVLPSAMDEACQQVLQELVDGLSEAERACAQVLACTSAGLSLTALLTAGVASQPVLAGLLDRGVLVAEGDVMRLRLPVGWFVRNKTPRAERPIAEGQCADLLLREGERARDEVRADPAVAIKALERIAKDLVLLVSEDQPETAVRAALALEPLLTGRLDRELVFGVWARATRAAAKVAISPGKAQPETRAKVTLAWVRTLIARGDHEVAEQVLKSSDELGQDPLSAAYRAIYLGHIEIWRGNLDLARVLLDEAEMTLAKGISVPEPARTHAREDAMLQRVFVAFEAGELDETERLCRHLAADAARTPSLRMVSLARRFCAEVLLRRDRPAEAAQLFERTRDELFTYGDATGALFLWSRRIEALKAAGETAAAKAEARAVRTMAAHAGEGAFEIACLQALDERDVPKARVAELAWRAQIRALRNEAEQWLAGQPGREPMKLLRLDPVTGVATLADRGAGPTSSDRAASPESSDPGASPESRDQGANAESSERSVSFARSRTLFRLLEGLADAHSRGKALSANELFALGWPGEHADPASTKQRVQTAIWTLRKKLLGDALITEPHGYCLSPSLQVTR